MKNSFENDIKVLIGAFNKPLLNPLNGDRHCSFVTLFKGRKALFHMSWPHKLTSKQLQLIKTYLKQNIQRLKR